MWVENEIKLVKPYTLHILDGVSILDFFKTQHGDDICSRSMERNQEVCQSMYN